MEVERVFAAGEEVRPQLVLRLVQLRRKDLLDAGPVVVLPGRVAAPRRLRRPRNLVSQNP